MKIESALQRILAYDQVLQTLVGNAVFPELAPPKTPLPFVSYSVQSSSPWAEDQISGYTCDTQTLVQIDAWAITHDNCIQIRDTILKILRSVEPSLFGIKSITIDDWYPGVDNNVFQQYRQTINITIIH